MKFVSDSALGVVFSGGESPPPSVIRKEIEGKKTFIVAADSGLAAAEEAGIKADYIVGDMDSIDVSRLDAYPPDCVMRYAREKDYTDTELAFAKAAEKGCEQIWIIGGGGGRIDHLFAIRSLFERERFPSRWITAGNDIRCIEAAERGGLLSLNVESGAQVSVFPLGEGGWKAKSRGLKWPLDELAWDRGFFGLSNLAPDGAFSVAALKGRFLIILPLPSETG